MNWVVNQLNNIFLFLDAIVYFFVALIYQVFLVVTRVNLFGDEHLATLTHRIYLILGVVMLFVFAYNILTMIAQPDNLTGNDEKSPGGLAKNMIISIVILALLPTIFTYLHRIQDGIIESNVIGNVFLGGSIDPNDQQLARRTGTNVALTIFSAFYHPIIDGQTMQPLDCFARCGFRTNCTRYDVSIDSTDICCMYAIAYCDAYMTGRIREFSANSSLRSGLRGSSPTMDYLAPFSTIAGVVAVYLILSFTIDVGVRVAKLGFLQVIAPIPVVLRITKPKGGTFDRWQNELVTTYMSLFLRLLFIFFAMYVITILPTVFWNMFRETFQEAEGVRGGAVGLIALVIVILGVLKFAKDGPKMIEELFNMKDIQVGIKKKLGENEYGMRAMSTIGAGVGTMSSNFWKGQKAVRQGIKDGDAKATLKGGFGGIAGMVTGLTGGARRGWKQGGVDSVDKLGGAINTARQETDAARERRSSFYAEPREGLKDMVTSPLESADKWLSGEYSNKKLKDLEAANNLFDELTGDVGGFGFRSITNARNSAGKNIYNPEKSDAIREGLLREGFWKKDSDGKYSFETSVPRPDQSTYNMADPGEATRYTADMNAYNQRKSSINASVVSDHYAYERAKALAEKGTKNTDLFKQYAERYLDTISSLDATTRETMLKKGGFTEFKQLETAFANITDSAISIGDKTKTMMDIMEATDSIGDQLKLQRSTVKKEQEKGS